MDDKIENPSYDELLKLVDDLIYLLEHNSSKLVTIKLARKLKETKLGNFENALQTILCENEGYAIYYELRPLIHKMQKVAFQAFLIAWLNDEDA